MIKKRKMILAFHQLLFACSLLFAIFLSRQDHTSLARISKGNSTSLILPLKQKTREAAFLSKSNRRSPLDRNGTHRSATLRRMSKFFGGKEVRLVRLRGLQNYGNNNYPPSDGTFSLPPTTNGVIVPNIIGHSVVEDLRQQPLSDNEPSEGVFVHSETATPIRKPSIVQPSPKAFLQPLTIQSHQLSQHQLETGFPSYAIVPVIYPYTGFNPFIPGQHGSTFPFNVPGQDCVFPTPVPTCVPPQQPQRVTPSYKTELSPFPPPPEPPPANIPPPSPPPLASVEVVEPSYVTPPPLAGSHTGVQQQTRYVLPPQNPLSAPFPNSAFVPVLSLSTPASASPLIPTYLVSPPPVSTPSLATLGPSYSISPPTPPPSSPSQMPPFSIAPPSYIVVSTKSTTTPTFAPPPETTMSQSSTSTIATTMTVPSTTVIPTTMTTTMTAHGAETSSNGTKLPLPECFIENAGYICCNREMRMVMIRAFEEPLEKKIKTCNTQIFANSVQKALETHYPEQEFEVVVGIADFASRSHFSRNYFCKTRIGNRYLLAYGTPHWQHPPNEQKEREGND